MFQEILTEGKQYLSIHAVGGVNKREKEKKRKREKEKDVKKYKYKSILYATHIHSPPVISQRTLCRSAISAFKPTDGCRPYKLAHFFILT